jgi:hypothetical protein
MREIKSIDFDGLISYNKWKQEHYQVQDGVKEVGCYWGNDGRIYTSYIKLF